MLTVFVAICISKSLRASFSFHSASEVVSCVKCDYIHCRVDSTSVGKECICRTRAFSWIASGLRKYVSAILLKVVQSAVYIK
jgi:hypothetical protein